MFISYTICIFINCLCSVLATISVRGIVVRKPRMNDIGLIFDLTIANEGSGHREMLEYRIRADGMCSLKLPNNREMHDAGRILGGNFGCIEAGASEIVSLIWPTVSLFNRVGTCPIVITSKNAHNQQKHMKKLVNFDTRFETLDPDRNIYRNRKDFKECKNWDMDNFDNCKPVNCEERYFGRRSFHNSTSKQCEEVPRCCKKSELYDVYANECIDKNNFLTPQDIQNIKDGKFENNFLPLKSNQGNQSKVVNLNDKNGLNFKVNSNNNHVNNMQANGDNNNNNNNNNNNINNNMFMNTKSSPEFEYMQNNQQQQQQGEQQQQQQGEQPQQPHHNLHEEPKRDTEDDTSQMPYWLRGISDGLLIVGVIIFFQVFATIAIYVLICFIIFLMVSWISRGQNNDNDDNVSSCVMGLGDSSDEKNTIVTTSSLMSQR